MEMEKNRKKGKGNLWRDEDARADDAPDDDHHAAEKADLGLQPHVLTTAIRVVVVLITATLSQFFFAAKKVLKIWKKNKFFIKF